MPGVSPSPRRFSRPATALAAVALALTLGGCAVTQDITANLTNQSPFPRFNANDEPPKPALSPGEKEAQLMSLEALRAVHEANAIKVITASP